ncbi:unnamed protein product, partial [Candidula unifasciata]
CSDEDKSVGMCGDVQSKQTPEVKDGERQQQTSAYIVVAVTLSVLLLISAIAAVLWKRHRRRHYNVEEFSALTYANPTYQKSSTETINADGRLTRHDVHFCYSTSHQSLTRIPLRRLLLYILVLPICELIAFVCPHTAMKLTYIVPDRRKKSKYTSAETRKESESNQQPALSMTRSG